jgi:hypothetical protein
MTTSRVQRYEAFASFYAQAGSLFGELANSDPRQDLLRHAYSFYVTPGGAMGGHDERRVDVFYGQRPFAGVTAPQPTPQGEFVLSKKLLPERGAQLRYLRADNGLVTCILEPAETESYRQREDGLLLGELLNPSRLRKQLPAHWRAFMSYMQCTCLEGEPTVLDRLRTFWLRSVKRLIVSQRAEGSRVCSAASTIGKYVLTIGLSGFVLFGLERFTADPGALQRKVLDISEKNGYLQGELSHYKDEIATQAERIDRLKQDVANNQAQLSLLRQQTHQPPPRKPSRSHTK